MNISPARSRSYSVLKNQNLTLVGNAQNNLIYGLNGHDRLYGMDGDDTIYAGAGNDYLNGGNGSDTLYGGAGHDTYYVAQSGDRVIEAAGEGYDTVLSDIGYTLPDNVEALRLQGSDNINGTGNSAGNDLLGNSGNNDLDGGAGDDVISGGAGDDYIEGSEGNDTLYGGEGQDVLLGGEGNDYLDGGADRTTDLLSGGAGDDVYVFGSGYGQDIVSDVFQNDGDFDTIAFGKGISADDLVFTQNVTDLVISVGEGDDLVVSGWFDNPETTIIDQFTFADGSAWSRSELVQAVDEQLQAQAAASIV